MNKKLLFPLAALLFSLTSCGGDTVKADTALEGLAAKGNEEGVVLSWKAEEKAEHMMQLESGLDIGSEPTPTACHDHGADTDHEA